MLKRYGLFVLTFGLMLFSLSGQAQQQDENAQGAATEQQDKPQILPLPLPVEIIESDAAAEARQRSEDEAKEREIRDLAAQEGVNVATQAMNDATQRMAQYAFWSTVTVGVGTILLFWTLLETRGTNQSARAAVDVSRKAVDVTQAQVRAYVGIDHVSASINEMDRPAVKVAFTNYGATTAKDVQVTVSCEIGPAGTVGGPARSVSITDRRSTLPINVESKNCAERTIVFDALTSEMVKSLTPLPATFIATIEIQYEDVFGDIRTEHQKFMGLAGQGQAWGQDRSLHRFAHLEKREPKQ